MGASQSTVRSSIQSTPKLMEVLANAPRPAKSIHIERLLEGDCDYITQGKRKDILIGLCNGCDEKNPMHNQCIKIGEENPASLMSFTESANTVFYTFERDIYLTVAKRDTGDVYYHLKTPIYNVTRSINPVVRKIYKPIGGPMTLELDKIDAIFKEQI